MAGGRSGMSRDRPARVMSMQAQGTWSCTMMAGRPLISMARS
jgi:hypothetical protein